MLRSGLIARLERYVTLTGGERDAIATLEQNELRFRAGETLVQEGGDCDRLFILHSGWLHAARRLPDGTRQILRFHFPGDLIGTSSMAWAISVDTLTAISDMIVSELPKRAVGRLFYDQPRLAGLLYAMAAAENVALSDRLVSIGRMDGETRMAYLLLDMLARLRTTAGGVVSSFDLPLTQADLGDAVGMTKVHVSRLLGRMEADGLVRRDGRRMRILDEARLVEMTGFIDRYHDIDSSWLQSGEPATYRMTAGHVLS